MISIIIPIYNAECWLEECLGSVANQDHSDFEVLMVDDGSTDSSLDICRKWTEKDSRFFVFSQKNSGVSSARNRAIEEARGNYICFVDSDDVVAPDYLSHLLDISKDGSFSVCGYTRKGELLGSGCKEIIQYGAKTFIVKILEESIDHPNICMMLFKRSIIQENKIKFFEGCIRNEDMEFYIHYLTYEQSVNVSQYRAYYYRPTPTSAMRAPITIKALTSIEASRRMNKFLVEKGVISDESIVFSNGVLTYAYFFSKSNNKDLYDYLHREYDVNSAMKKMQSFPRFSKKMVAISYLMLGRDLFFKFIGFQRFFK